MPLNIQKELKPQKVNSSLEFISAPTMRKAYKKKLEQQNMAHQKEVTNYNLVDTRGDRGEKTFSNPY